MRNEKKRIEVKDINSANVKTWEYNTIYINRIK